MATAVPIADPLVDIFAKASGAIADPCAFADVPLSPWGGSKLLSAIGCEEGAVNSSAGAGWSAGAPNSSLADGCDGGAVNSSAGAD